MTKDILQTVGKSVHSKAAKHTDKEAQVLLNPGLLRRNLKLNRDIYSMCLLFESLLTLS